MSIKTSLYEIYLEASYFLKKVYPDFVTSRRPGRIKGIPVFTFHSIRPDIFGEQLEFLKENNYVTIGPGDLYGYLIGERTLPERAILLTIDDGRRSVWEYGFPLLKKYGFRATVFVIPGHTKEESSGFRVQSEEDEKDILTWQEIKIMQESGLIDFGSHTLYHHKIFTGPEIVDFFGPDHSRRPYDYPATPAGLEGIILEEPSEFYGMPIYINDFPMAGKPRYMDDPEFREECMRYFRERFNYPSPQSSPPGGEVVMRGNHLSSGERVLSKEWKREMFRFSSEYRKSKGGANHARTKFLSLEETGNEIYDNLFTSKRILEERLGKPVNHLCYPFGIWSRLSTEMTKKAGYLSAFCAYIPGRPINKAGDDPHKIVRLKDDYIFRLPGKGRKSLSEILIFKMKRRLKGERVY